MKKFPSKKYIKVLEGMTREELIRSHIREAELRGYYQDIYYDLCNLITNFKLGKNL